MDLKNLQNAKIRLQAIQQTLTGSTSQRLVLPDLSEVRIGTDTVTLDGNFLARFTELPRTASLAISAIGTPYEDSNPIPKYPVVEIVAPSSGPQLDRESTWIIIYALFSI